MKLIHGALPQQMDKHSGRLLIGSGGCNRLRGFDDLRLCMPASDRLPSWIRTDSIARESKRLLQKNETVRMPVTERKPIITPSRVGSYSQFSFQLRTGFGPAKQLIIGAATALDELIQAASSDHPIHHLEEAKKVGFS